MGAPTEGVSQKGIVELLEQSVSPEGASQETQHWLDHRRSNSGVFVSRSDACGYACWHCSTIFIEA